MSTPIVVEGLCKRFGSFDAVTDVTFTAPAGAVTALLGPSGSGKSTVLRMIAGLEEPTAGRIFMGDEELTVKSVQERRVGFVFQHYALFRHMTVQQNVEFGLRVRKAERRRSDVPAWRTCSSWCTWRRSRIATPINSPVASVNAWRWRARWRHSPASCCSTSRSARSTPRCARTCAAGSTSCTASSASPACSSPTTRKKRWSSRTRSS